MEQEKIIEGNKLIAEFMGWKFEETKDPHWMNYVSPDGNSFLERDTYMERLLNRGLGYQKRWENLMPVWKKIIDLNLVETEDMCIREPWGYKQDIRNALSDGEIKPVWDATVKLITWYNTLPTTNSLKH